MQRSSSTFKFWLAAGILILSAGFALAYAVKIRAFANTAAQYRIVGGQAYLAQDEESKQDADEAQRFGGTPALIVAAYKRKLHTLLQGDNLAYLLAIAAVILAWGCFRMAWEEQRLD